MSELRGTGELVRLIVRRDRMRIAAWLVGILVLVWVSAVSTKGIYPTQAELDRAAAVTIDNPAALAFNGPAQALDTMGGQIAFQIGAFGLVVVGLMSLLLVGRVTRGEEDSGRLELVRSMPVGRHAPLAAGLAMVTAINAVLGVLVTVILIGQDLPVMGSVVFGASFTAFGLAFVGITAFTAQVSENPRVSAGIAGAVLGISFALRALGDAGNGATSWLSPMGWAQRTRPYAGERWWPLVLLLALGGSLVVAAVALADRRDFGAGLVQPKPGPAHGASSLANPIGLAARLSRAAVFWWAVSVLLLALVYGSLAEAIDDFVADNKTLTDVIAAFGGASLIDSYLATSLLTMALVATGPALQVVLRLRTEETALRAEPVLATPTTRLAWVRGQLLPALGGGWLTLACGGLGLGAAYAVTGGGANQVPRLVLAALTYVPAVSVVTALAVALFGVAPRWAMSGAWVALGACFVIAMFGSLLDLPDWVSALSPFHHTPAVPAHALQIVPLAVLSALAAALVAVGLVAFRRRDILTS